MTRQIVFAIVIFLHDLFTVIWIGGLIGMGFVFLPAARRVLGMGPQLQELADAVQRRLSLLVWTSIVGLIVTGLLLARRAPAFLGLFQTGNAYSAVLAGKHLLVLLMIGVTALRSLVLRRADPRWMQLKGALVVLNMALGVLVLLLSGFSAALGAGPG